jgi:NAD(P)-dependent dehydrogenase (short-subunit alcohol dehydrogenase family)
MPAIRDVSSVATSELLVLSGRVAVVTGGARGIGRACCARLVEAGAAVLVGDVDGEAARDAAEAIGPPAVAVEADVREAASIRALVEQALARFGRLDVWVNAAGIYPTAPLLELTDVDWDEVLDVNLRGTFIGAREAARAMVAGGEGGVIVNVSSTAAYRAEAPGASHYVASKFGVRGLTRSLAVELGTHGIRVLGVAPTVTLTPGLEAARSSLEAVGFALEDELGPRLPLGRVAVPDDVARVVLFCASDLSLLMTGSTLLVDAGELV